MDYAETAIYLAGCAVNGNIPDKSRLEAADMAGLYAFTQAHMIPAIVGYALESAGIKHELFTQARAKALRKAVIFESDLRKISVSLEEAGIWHMPLKGSVMKGYYPAFGLREMSDIDIAFDSSRADDVRKIMTGLGFWTEDFCNHTHDVYHREPVSNVEMHRGLMETWLNPAMGDYYYDVRDKMILDDGKKYTYHFGPEDFYLYITAHTYKHYSEGGTGLRSLLDCYVYMKKFADSLDWEYISREAGKMNITEFERDFRNLAVTIFGDGESGNVSREMLGYITASGAYGHIDNEMEHITAGAFGGSRLRYLLARIFPPFSKLKYMNPHVYTHKYLYPVFVLRRLWRAATVSRKNVIARLRRIFSRRKGNSVK
ncbi:MAG: nucleotidyltransferase family protein [Synergistaceae bacterium]|nr:nucleotidyltransferase family protein [Synergistaceae bacterium]MBQ7168925.1 nucleotidyltransferase family protein [Synergistaceae bacterium]